MELTREVLEGLRINRDEWQTRACQEEFRADALEIERDRYRAALEGLLPLVRDYRDDGAYPEGWQSPELQAALDAARAALEPAQKEAQDAEAGQ